MQLRNTAPIINLLKQIDWAQFEMLYQEKTKVPMKTLLLLTMYHLVFDDESELAIPLDQKFISQFGEVKALIQRIHRFQDVLPNEDRLRMAKKYTLKYLFAELPISKQSVEQKLFSLIQLILSYYVEINGNNQQPSPSKLTPHKRLLKPHHVFSPRLETLLSKESKNDQSREEVQSAKFRRLEEEAPPQGDRYTSLVRLPVPVYLRNLHERMLVRMARATKDKNVQKVSNSSLPVDQLLNPGYNRPDASIPRVKLKFQR